MATRLMATRVELDRSRPCLACGAAWRIVSESSEILAVSDPGHGSQSVMWEPKRSGCSAECWRHNQAAYDRGILDRGVRGWLT